MHMIRRKYKRMKLISLKPQLPILQRIPYQAGNFWAC
jgi:hypothetical protein